MRCGIDRLTRQHRSWNMSRIKSRDTKPERAVRQFLHRLGFRFRLSTGQRLYGKPDIVLPKYRTVIFVHGCFWHRHTRCKECSTPKTRVDFWHRKFQANVARDAKVRRRLRREGWHIVVIWECQIPRIEELKKRFLEIKSRHA